MPLFFIEMGQGIIVEGNDLRVCTSALRSCTLIAGYNSMLGNVAGAYHYPAEAFKNKNNKAHDAMLKWVYEFTPDQVVLVHARKDAVGEGGTSLDDKEKLKRWIQTYCEVTPTKVKATSAGMELLANTGFSAGDIKNLNGNFVDHVIRLDNLPTGKYKDHGGFALIGSVS